MINSFPPEHILSRDKLMINSFSPEHILSRDKLMINSFPPERLLSRLLANIYSLRYDNNRSNQSTAKSGETEKIIPVAKS